MHTTQTMRSHTPSPISSASDPEAHQPLRVARRAKSCSDRRIQWQRFREPGEPQQTQQASRRAHHAQLVTLLHGAHARADQDADPSRVTEREIRQIDDALRPIAVVVKETAEKIAEERLSGDVDFPRHGRDPPPVLVAQ